MYRSAAWAFPSSRMRGTTPCAARPPACHAFRSVTVRRWVCVVERRGRGVRGAVGCAAAGEKTVLASASDERRPLRSMQSRKVSGEGLRQAYRATRGDGMLRSADRAAGEPDQPPGKRVRKYGLAWLGGWDCSGVVGETRRSEHFTRALSSRNGGRRRRMTGLAGGEDGGREGCGRGEKGDEEDGAHHHWWR